MNFSTYYHAEAEAREHIDRLVGLAINEKGVPAALKALSAHYSISEKAITKGLNHPQFKDLGIRLRDNSSQDYVSIRPVGGPVSPYYHIPSKVMVGPLGEQVKALAAYWIEEGHKAKLRSARRDYQIYLNLKARFDKPRGIDAEAAKQPYPNTKDQ